MKGYRLLTALLFMILAGLGSCKKKDTSLNDLRIATIDYSFAGSIRHYRFVYDRNNNVDSILWVGDGSSSGSSGFKVFNYFGSSFSITDEYGNAITVQANTNGQILKVLQADTVVVHYKNGVVEAVDHKTTTTKTTQYYKWADGAITKVWTNASDTLTYYYDTNIGGQAGDPWRVDDFLTYGRSYIKTNRLPFSVLNELGVAVSYYYQYDTRGRISQLMKVNTAGAFYDTATYNYRYY